MFKIDKIRFHGVEKLNNRFYVYAGAIAYVVRRPLKEKPLTSIDIIKNCKTEDDLFNLGASLAPKGGKMSLEEFLVAQGLN